MKVKSYYGNLLFGKKIIMDYTEILEKICWISMTSKQKIFSLLYLHFV